MKKILILLYLLLSYEGGVFAQSVKIQPPTYPKNIKENESVGLRLNISPDSLQKRAKYFCTECAAHTAILDSAKGVFSWKPSFQLVKKDETPKPVNFTIKVFVRLDSATILSDSTTLTFEVANANRPPIITEDTTIVWVDLPNKNKTLTLPKIYFYDEDGDDIFFRLTSKRHAGISLSTDGVLNYQFSMAEYRQLPLLVLYEVADMQRNATQAKFLFQRSNIDVPPLMSISPRTLNYQIDEGDTIRIAIDVFDPNNDLCSVDAYAEPRISKFMPERFLRKISEEQYRFEWSPNNDFVETIEGKRNFDLYFAAKDQTDSTSRTKVSIEVKDRINWQEEDAVREKDYRYIVQNATETILRMEGKVAADRKAFYKFLHKKKTKEILSNALSTLTANGGAALDNYVSAFGGSTDNLDPLKNKLSVANSTMQLINPNVLQQFSLEDQKMVTSFTDLVKAFSTLFTETELFIALFGQTKLRRGVAFYEKKMTLQKIVSDITHDAIMNLAPLENSITDADIQARFGEYKAP
jgi:hypothetical protein